MKISMTPGGAAYSDENMNTDGFASRLCRHQHFAENVSHGKQLSAAMPLAAASAAAVMRQKRDMLSLLQASDAAKQINDYDEMITLEQAAYAKSFGRFRSRCRELDTSAGGVDSPTARSLGPAGLTAGIDIIGLDHGDRQTAVILLGAPSGAARARVRD